MYCLIHLAATKRRLRTLSSAYGVYEALSWLAGLIGSGVMFIAEYFA